MRYGISDPSKRVNGESFRDHNSQCKVSTDSSPSVSDSVKGSIYRPNLTPTRVISSRVEVGREGIRLGTEGTLDQMRVSTLEPRPMVFRVVSIELKTKI